TEAVGGATVNIEVIAPPPVKPENPLVSLFTKYWPILLIACLGLVIVIPVTVAVFFLTKPKPEMAPPPPAEAQHTLIASPPDAEGAMATLKVLEGPPGLKGETLYINKVLTLIGRNPKMANMVFYPNEDSSVSRLHCTIQLDGKYFLLIDNHSANGTRINGELLKPDSSVQLRDGDEIVLGDLAKLGVKLQFNLLTETAAPKESAGLDRTFYIDTGDKDELDKQAGN
ncbi:MAG: FHA domain-containing protein, partial [Chloroflexi bacterium]|nr:FHA domain-containing protein [Chloroflexota bacterium]